MTDPQNVSNKLVNEDPAVEKALRSVFELERAHRRRKKFLVFGLIGCMIVIAGLSLQLFQETTTPKTIKTTKAPAPIVLRDSSQVKVFSSPKANYEIKTIQLKPGLRSGWELL